VTCTSSTRFSNRGTRLDYGFNDTRHDGCHPVRSACGMPSISASARQFDCWLQADTLRQQTGSSTLRHDVAITQREDDPTCSSTQHEVSTMRDALILAAKASEGKLAVTILGAARRIKVRKFGGWFKLNGGRRGNGRRSR